MAGKSRHTNMDIKKRQTDKRTNGQTDKQTNRQADKQTSRQTDKRRE